MSTYSSDPSEEGDSWKNVGKTSDHMRKASFSVNQTSFIVIYGLVEGQFFDLNKKECNFFFFVYFDWNNLSITYTKTNFVCIL